MSNNRAPARLRFPQSTLPTNVLKRPMLSAEHIRPYIPPSERPHIDTSGHYHWRIQAFEWADDDGALHDVVTVFVEAPDEESAYLAAMQAVVRPAYRITYAEVEAVG